MAMYPRDFQTALTAQGLSPGEPDGIWGPKTERAAKQWFALGTDLLQTPPTVPGTVGMSAVNDDKFFVEMRRILGPLSQSEVNGINLILAEAKKRNTPINQFSYMGATDWWETGKSWQPVREAYYLNMSETAKEAWRKRNLRYWPYYGRGLVQLTWEYNYRRAGQKLGLDLVNLPDLALRPDVAVQIMFDGMEEGWFTGKALDDYIDEIDEPDSEDLAEYVNARKIINGTDKALTIGKMAVEIEHAVRASI